MFIRNPLILLVYFLGLSYITEIQHPYDKEPPLFQCDVCRHSCIAKEIIPHIVAKSHQLKFFVSICMMFVLVCVENTKYRFSLSDYLEITTAVVFLSGSGKTFPHILI